MKKIWKNKSGISFWSAFFFFLFLGMALYFGEKEQQLYREFEENILQEQKEIPKQENQVKTEEKIVEAPEEKLEEKQEERNIRVLLQDSQENSPFHKEVVVQSSKGIQIVRTGAFDQILQEVPADTPVDVGSMVKTYGNVTVKSGEGGRVTVLSLKRGQRNPSYEGVLEVSPGDKGYFLINQVDLETYLKYVIPSEMPAYYPAEALKAQAVCARTYAIRQKGEGRLAEYGADVDDTVSYQVYNKVERQPETDRAVEETAGVTMTWNGAPIQAYFFSTSCGYTSTDEVWETDSPAEYLQSVSVSKQEISGQTEDVRETVVWGKEREPFSEEKFRHFILEPGELDYEKDEPWYRWQVTLPVAQIQEKCDTSLGEIKEIRVLERSDGGAVKKLQILGEKGEQTVKNEYRIREFLAVKEIPVYLQDGTEAPVMNLLPSAYFVIDPVREGERLMGFLIRGGGYGHGVGMSQNGAKHLAEEGMNWEEILQSFYRQVTLAGQDKT